MRQYIVQITNKALKDMEEIYNYIAEQLLVPDSAVKQYNRIAKAIEGLNIFPERVRIVDFEPESTKGLRQLSIDNYFVFYVIKEEKVIVTRVLYSAFDISKRLKEN